MKKKYLFLSVVFAAIFSGCKSPHARCGRFQPVKAGIDVLEADGFKELRGKKIGLITNMPARDLMGRPTASILAGAPEVRLVRIFATEHGLWALSESTSIDSSSIVLDGRSVPVTSLYGGNLDSMRPTPKDLAGLDALVFDLPDIGARFYTYLTTMGLALSETAKLNIEFIVLDRPNPITGVIVEGPILGAKTLAKLNPTAYSPVSIRHGMTAGEIALLENKKIGDKKLTVIKLKGWKRRMWFDETGLLWFPPSPNIPDLNAATLYPGIGIFEASNISVGRGTPWPFTWIGAPWMNSRKVILELNALHIPGAKFIAHDTRPQKSVFAGQLCHGVRIKIVDRNILRPVSLFLDINSILMRDFPKKFIWHWKQLRLMAGTKEFRRLIQAKASLKTLQSFLNHQALRFKKQRQPFLLYR
jgi:uncharacterized protein YbbC (DUF1343 family)